MKAIHDTRVVCVLAVWAILLPIAAFLPIPLQFVIERDITAYALGAGPHGFDDWYNVAMALILLTSIVALIIE